MTSDLLASLFQRGLQHVVEAIYGYLDCDCLRRAELVSDVWQEMVSDERLWRALHSRNMRIFPRWKAAFTALAAMKHERLTLREDDSLPDSYRQACCVIDDQLQELETNWKTMTYSECSTDFGPRYRPLHIYEADYFDMSDSWIAIVNRDDNTIVVCNRWTLVIVHVLEIPIDQILFNGYLPIVNCVKINALHCHNMLSSSGNLPLGYGNHDFGVLAADAVVVEVGDGNYGNNKVTLAFGPSLWHNLLLSCYTKVTDEFPEISTWTLTLSRLPARTGEMASVLHKTVFSAMSCYVCGLFLDDTYTVFCFVQFSSGFATFNAEIRSTTSFEMTNTIRFDANNGHRGSHYSLGLLVTYGLQSFSIWNVGTGEHIYEMEQQERFLSIRLVSTQFIVSCDYSSRICIWGLQSAVPPKGGPSAVTLLKTIPSFPCPFPRSWFAVALAADEFQIAVVAQCVRLCSRRRSYSLLFKNFLSSAK